jgi:hypothetical protein
MPSQEHLYVITASNEDAKQHVQKSIANPIDPAICVAHFPNDVLDEVRRKRGSGRTPPMASSHVALLSA